MGRVSELLARATAATSLEDFGESSFREGLERLVVSADTEARLSTRGAAAFDLQIVDMLSWRLQIEHWYRLHPQIEEMPHHWNKLRVEEMLLRSGLDITILQPTAYMQNSLPEWDRMKRDGIFRVPYPIETRLSLVDLDDVAEVAALALTNAGHSGAT